MIYLSGMSNGSFTGANRGSYDIFLMKYDGNGNRLRAEELGSDSYDTVTDLYLDESNSKVHVSGWVQGQVGEQYFGSWDPVLLSRDE